MAAALPPLYAIVDVDVCERRGRAPLALADGYLAGGVRLLQIRAKGMAGGGLLALAEAVRSRADALGAAVVVNDRIDVAGAAGTGVHVGQHDVPPAVARRLLGPHALVGYSTHTLGELARALTEPVSYVAFGPVFGTTTKAAPDPVVGLDALREAARRARAAGVPLVAIGGITLETAGDVLAAGASSVAVIGDLLREDADPEARARRFLMALGAPHV